MSTKYRAVTERESTYEPEVLRILSEAIDSLEKLEIVVYLHAAGSGGCTTAEIAKTLSQSRDETLEALTELAQAGVVRDEEPWLLAGDGPWTAAVIKLVAQYEQDRLDVVSVMARLAVERIRTRAARMFADAFLIRTPKKGKGKDDG